MDVLKEFEILRIENSLSQTTKDRVITEHCLAVYLNGRRFADLVCSPVDLDALVCGHLFTKGIIKQQDDLKELSIYGDRADATVQMESNLKISHSVVAVPAGPALEIMDLFPAVEAFNDQSPLFAATGGVHNCGLYCSGEKYIIVEDVGRHSAMDKVLGKALFQNRDLSSCFLVTSGRISQVMVAKTLVAGISILISRSAPTAAAVELARSNNLTLCGFARGKRMNIYSGAERIRL